LVNINADSDDKITEENDSSPKEYVLDCPEEASTSSTACGGMNRKR